jgi:putative ABC transport system ATP-binding protein
MTMPGSLIKLENVSKKYQLGKVELVVLKDINLEINPGSFVSIMGPSGSGKSTLMYLLGCLDTPTSGSIFLEDKDVSKFSEDELARVRGRKIGFIFQQFNLMNHLNAIENVMLPMVFQGIPEAERIKKARNLLESVGMAERMKHRPNELSGGEQQRIAIARAFSNSPEILIADEPTGNLDSNTGKIVMEILTNFHKTQKKTIVVVTHDPNIAGYSEQIINIKDGQIIKNGHQAASVLWKG